MMAQRAGIAALSLLLLCAAHNVAISGQSAEALSHDRSDWWSLINAQPPDVVPRQTLMSNADLTIAGMDVLNFTFEQLYLSLGRAGLMRRGDASLWREQVCYTTSSDGSPVYLVFEKGEVSSSAYLFSDAKAWKGRSLCVKAPQSLGSFQTLSGLRLGQTPEQVQSILGATSKREPNELIYRREGKMPTPPDALTVARRQHPELSSKEFSADYATYDVSEYICAKFVNSKLVYLAIFTTATT